MSSPDSSSPTGTYTDLDGASGLPLHPAAQDVLTAALERGYADPRRQHRSARETRMLWDNAREVSAECLGLRRDEVTFTASGTEAVQRGLAGLALARRRRARGVLVSAVEHQSVLHTADWISEWIGGEVTTLPVDARGRLRDGVFAEELARLREKGAPPAVAALQTANHEVGTTQPVTETAGALDGVPLFVDACASLGHADLPDGWDVAAGSAHKWGGPAGVGLLLVRHGTRWRSPFPADDRVDPRSTGFENVPAALAAAAALRAVLAEREATAARQRQLIDLIRHRVAQIPDVDVVGDPEERLPHLVTFSCLYLDGEVLVGELDRAGFGVASGSACTASTLEPSHVLAAMGALTHGNVRLALGPHTTRDEIESFLRLLPDVVARARDAAGVR